jgi:hypothetical protein
MAEDYYLKIDKLDELGPKIDHIRKLVKHKPVAAALPYPWEYDTDGQIIKEFTTRNVKYVPSCLCPTIYNGKEIKWLSIYPDTRIRLFADERRKTIELWLADIVLFVRHMYIKSLRWEDLCIFTGKTFCSITVEHIGKYLYHRNMIEYPHVFVNKINELFEPLPPVDCLEFTKHTFESEKYLVHPTLDNIDMIDEKICDGIIYNASTDKSLIKHTKRLNLEIYYGSG